MPKSTTTPPPVRHGKARLVVLINGTPYKVRRRPSGIRGGKLWCLTKPDGTSHVVSQCQSNICCTCPDHGHRAARCKHIGALVAVGLASRRAKLTGPFLAPQAAQVSEGGAA